jgi:hypothetical protein
VMPHTAQRVAKSISARRVAKSPRISVTGKREDSPARPNRSGGLHGAPELGGALARSQLRSEEVGWAVLNLNGERVEASVRQRGAVARCSLRRMAAEGCL